MGDFSDTYNLKSLITEPKCYKNLENPTCIDFFLTNHLGIFENSFVFERDLYDFHETTMTNQKIFSKASAKIYKL